MQLNLPTGDAVSAWSEATHKLTRENNGRILLAVSGGPDSLAMLLLAKAAKPERICAATVDHGLRPESAVEASFVGELCASLSVPHSILRPPHPIAGNVQSGAREVRYKLLSDHADAAGCQWIATAHHADDQLETLLMRLARGSGVNGLSGVRARQGRIIRPMLGFRKAALEAICAEGGVDPVHDPSNADEQFDRVAMRQWLAGDKHPFDAMRAARSAAAMADAAVALDWMSDQLATERIHADGEALTLSPADLPIELQRRLLLRALARIEPAIAPRGDAIDRVLEELPMGKRLTIGDVLCEGGDIWRFSQAPARMKKKRPA